MTNPSVDGRLEPDRTLLAEWGKAVFGSVYSPETIFVMLTWYLDEAGSSKDHFIVVCGWGATAERWERFEIDWKLLLASYGVPYFHMKEFAHSTGPFLKWKNAPIIRDRFIQQATGIIRRIVGHGVLCYVDHKAFDILDRQFQLSECFPSPYALAGRACVSLADHWLRVTRNETAAGNANFVFERGGPDQGGLGKAIAADPGFPAPIFKPSRDKANKRGDIEKGIVQLQAADLLAYECRKAKQEFHDKTGRDARKSFYKILGVEDFSMATCHADNIVDIMQVCQIAELKPRLERLSHERLGKLKDSSEEV